VKLADDLHDLGGIAHGEILSERLPISRLRKIFNRLLQNSAA
jgi:hypothetical protein